LRIFLRRSLKKQAKIWIRIFPNLPITKKPEEVRMGKGKASVKKWSARVRPGQIIFELKTKASIKLKKTLNFSNFKISLKTKSLNQKMWWIF
jgi:large subunit ribosomal protein L16